MLVDRPEDADILIFVETSTCAGPYFETVRRHPTYRRHRERSYVYCATDLIVPVVPGVFPSISKENYLPAWSRAGGYIGIHERPSLVYDAEWQPSRLFSFVGASATHPLRRRIMRLDHPGGLLIDTADDPPGGLSRADYERRYREALRDSAFILCPRGGGPSTFRLMQAMIMGRAPVIISDAWCAPIGPRWDEFSIRVPESDVDEIPRLLEERRPEAGEMGRLARQAWVDWFGPEAAFHRTVEWALDLHESSSLREGLGRLRPWMKASSPYHLLRRTRWRFRRAT